MDPRVIVEIVAGPLAGKRFVFEEHDTFVFGRASDCQACLDGDTLVSRHHFLLEVNPPDLVIRDLGSRNGTFVDGKKIGAREREESPESAARRDLPAVPLQHGAVIKAGRSELRVQVLDESAPGKRLAEITPEEGEAILNLVFRPKPLVVKPPQKAAQPAENPKPPVVAGGGPAARRELEIPGYRLEREIGRGGFGVVFRGTCLKSGAAVAIKVAMVGKGSPTTTLRLFEREVENIRGLRHPGIVRVLSSGVAENLLYLVMELCGEGSLVDKINGQGGPLRLEEMRPVMLDAVGALAFAHEAGVVHRDLKPSNLLFSGGRVLIGDFGLAKQFRRAGLSGMTVTGHYGGTVIFMPREQLLSFKYTKPVSDVWSLAATFYFALTGCLPFDFPPKRDPIGIVLNERVIPIEKRRSDLPSGLTRVLNRALTIRVDERYPSASVMSRELAAALH